MRTCVGIDAAKTVHWALAVDKGRRIVLDRAVENDPEAIGALVGRLRALEGEAATAELVRELAVEALEAGQKIARIVRELEALLRLHPDGALVRSLPGMGVVLAAEFLACTGDIRRFATADALASAAGLAPVGQTRRMATGRWRR